MSFRQYSSSGDWRIEFHFPASLRGNPRALTTLPPKKVDFRPSSLPDHAMALAMAVEQTSPVLLSSGTGPTVSTSPMSPSSDAARVEPASPEPMDTSTAVSKPAETEATSPGAGATAGRESSIPVRRRNRPALSCIQCRTRKVRCDRNEPCNSCVKSKIVNCTYEEARRPKPKFWRLPTGDSPSPGRGGDGARGSAYSEVQLSLDVDSSRYPSSSSHSYTAPAAAVTSAGGRVADSVGGSNAHPHLDGSAPGASASPDSSNALALRVKELEAKLVEALKRQDGGHPPDMSIPATLSKTRYFGASHWMNKIKLVSLRRLSLLPPTAH